uniref:Uncharacterized protein n=1 Tax=Oryza glaberrima TaxID=4538 RepID=I1NST1_ORYGL
WQLFLDIDCLHRPTQPWASMSQLRIGETGRRARRRGEENDEQGRRRGSLSGTVAALSGIARGHEARGHDPHRAAAPFFPASHDSFSNEERVPSVGYVNLVRSRSKPSWRRISG